MGYPGKWNLGAPDHSAEFANSHRCYVTEPYWPENSAAALLTQVRIDSLNMPEPSRATQ
jgi:hypothetical protein